MLDEPYYNSLGQARQVVGPEILAGAYGWPMSRYVVRVQLVKWFEIVVNAQSPKEAIGRAETLRPARICARGKEVHAETGLADPESLRLLEKENEG